MKKITLAKIIVKIISRFTTVFHLIKVKKNYFSKEYMNKTKLVYEYFNLI